MDNNNATAPTASGADQPISPFILPRRDARVTKHVDWPGTRSASPTRHGQCFGKCSPSYGQDALKSLQSYVQIRLDITRHTLSGPELNAAIGQSNKIQEALWRDAMAVAAKDTAMVPTGVFIQSLNEMIDNQGKRLAALRSRVPNIVFLALYGAAIVAFILAGYANGLLEKQRVRLPVYVMGLLVSAVILLIQDLDRPTAGFISVSQQPIDRCCDEYCSLF